MQAKDRDMQILEKIVGYCEDIERMRTTSC